MKNAELATVSSELSNAVCLVLRLWQLSFDLDGREVDSLASALSADVELADAAHVSKISLTPDRIVIWSQFLLLSCSRVTLTA